MSSTDHALVLRAGEQMAERAVCSPDGVYVLVQQHDGNLVIYRTVDDEAVWASGTMFQDSPDLDLVTDTEARPGVLRLRNDGELEVIDADGEQEWSADARGRRLVLENSGQAVLLTDEGERAWETPEPDSYDDEDSYDEDSYDEDSYDEDSDDEEDDDEDREPGLGPWSAVPDGRRLRRGQVLRWQTLTSDNGRYTLVSTREGFVYLRQVGGPVLWIHYLGQLRGLQLTTDGLLRDRNVEDECRPVRFLGVPEDLRAAELSVADDGRIRLTDESGTVVWASARPEELGPYPSLPRPRASIDLTGIQDFDVLVVKTAFGSEDDWNRLADQVRRSEFDDENTLFVIDAPVWAGAGPNEVVSALLDHGGDLPDVVFLYDEESVANRKTLLAVDLGAATDPDDEEDPDEEIPRFRIEPDRAGPMAVNLGLGNMDFDDWRD
ncbi:DUF6924 domain-containing protein [Cryptosporangium japonicum]|uniref:Bulb-type lectin domain-containing protein n=1 Tax=Cryptosporangium japonicum TaxID=80872 RepID=A0ABN0U5M7_9ACTN